jgi:N-acetylglucosamine transport system permease protein
MRQGKYPFIICLLVLPLLVYGVFMLSPLVQTVVYSFTDWGARRPDFQLIGLANYRELLTDPVFRKAFGNSMFFFLTLPVATITLALFFAFMVNVGGRGDRAGVRGVFGSSVYKVIFFFPFILSIAIVAIVWGTVLRTDRFGLANSLLMAVGLVEPDRPLLFLSHPDTVKWVLLGIAVWGATGFFMLPLLRDSVSVAWVYLGILALDMFALVYALTPQQGGPNNASQVMATQVYQTAFGSYRPGQFGYACAMGVTLALFTLVLAIIQLRVLRRDRIEY